MFGELASLPPLVIHPRSFAYAALWWLPFTLFAAFALLFTTTTIAFFDTDLASGLRGRGIPVAIGHDARHVGDAEALVVTGALCDPDADCAGDQFTSQFHPTGSALSVLDRLV